MPVAPQPNFFIVGGPKCGTTALYSYLRNHPQIFMCPIKEPQFFASDILGHQRRIQTLPEYLDCFRDAGKKKSIGEASTAYLGSRVAASEIKVFSPYAQIIVMLRNPVDVMYAQHSERVFSNVEHILDFEAALNSKEIRRWRSGPFKNQAMIRLEYRELSRFAEQVQRYFDVFGRERVHVIIYDDFKIDTSSVLRGVLNFLGVTSDYQTPLRVFNANRRARSMAVQDFLRHPPKGLRSFARMVLPDNLRSGLVECVRKLNILYEPRPPLNHTLRERLQKELEPEVEQLSRLLDRDLGAWCSGI